MLWSERLCRFQFHNQAVIDKHIHKVVSHTISIFIKHFQRTLPLDLVPSLYKPMFKCNLIYLFQKPITKILMHAISYLPNF